MTQRGRFSIAFAVSLAMLCAPQLMGQEAATRKPSEAGLRRLTPRQGVERSEDVIIPSAKVLGPAPISSKSTARDSMGSKPKPLKDESSRRAAAAPRTRLSSSQPPPESQANRPVRAQANSEKEFVRRTAAQEPATEEPKAQSTAPKSEPDESEETPRTRKRKVEEPEGDEEVNRPELLPSPNRNLDERLLQFRSARPAELSVSLDGELITLTAKGAPLAEVVEAIAEQHGLNLVAGDEVAGAITVSLRKVTLQEALRAVLLVNGYTWHQDGNILIVSDLSAESRTPNAQRGAMVRVFAFNFVAADDIDKVVQGLLSPVGKTFITASQSTDKRKTREELVVQDLPEYLERIEQYIAQVDRPPRQVLVEAHILQVDLRDEFRHGVNLTALARVAGSDVTLRTLGLAAPAASPAMFFGIDGTDLDSLIEAMRTMTDAKTLASPKVLVVNGQEAKLQVGGQLGYFMTTTTQTSSMQSVQFLDVGVVLSVTPVIADDGNVLMSVKPEVSKGRINAQTNLPEKDTTQTSTTLMLQSGQGMVIGGLIQETDQETLGKVPLLGDIPMAGWLFRRKVTEQRRQELIIAVVPRIVPLADCAADREQLELDRALTPLLHGPVCTKDRTQFEPVIKGMREHRPFKERECDCALCNPEMGPRNCDRDRPGTYVESPMEVEEVREGARTPSKGAVRSGAKPPVVSSTRVALENSKSRPNPSPANSKKPR